jgi:octaprenyl-diphosphate synthase
VGDDFRDGKITLPVLLAYARGSEPERAFWRRTLEELEQEPADLERAQALLAKHGAIAETLARADAYGGRARQNLAAFPASRAKSAMLDLVDFCVERAY